MMWRTPDQHYLIRQQLQPIQALYGPVPHILGIPLKAATFVLVTSAGRVVQHFSAPQDYSLEDDYGICNIHSVEGQTLYEYHWMYGWGGHMRLTQYQILTDLQPCTPTMLTRIRSLLVTLNIDVGTA